MQDLSKLGKLFHEDRRYIHRVATALLSFCDLEHKGYSSKLEF